MGPPPLSLHAWLRWDVVDRTLRSWPDVRSVLEVGAGVGGVGARLAERYAYVGVEPDERSFALASARVRGGEVIHGDVSAVPADRSFDVVCAFEVLEHLPDDAAALGTWLERLRPGGRVLVSVPAWQRLYGASDAAVGHVRRYDPETLRALLERADLEEIELRGYGFPLGHLLRPAWNLAARRRQGGTTASGRWFQPPRALGAATAVAATPFRLAQRPFRDLRLATGVVASGRRS